MRSFEDKALQPSNPNWVILFISGPLMNRTAVTMTTMMLNVMLDHKLEEHDLERFWNLESMGISPKNAVNCVESYVKSGITLKERKYYAKCPFTDDCPELPTNKNIVLKRTEIRSIYMVK